MAQYANVIAALILSAALLVSAWMVSQNGRYSTHGNQIQTVLDTRTGVVCTGAQPGDRFCLDPHNGVGLEVSE